MAKLVKNIVEHTAKPITNIMNKSTEHAMIKSHYRNKHISYVTYAEGVFYTYLNAVFEPATPG